NRLVRQVSDIEGFQDLTAVAAVPSRQTGTRQTPSPSERAKLREVSRETEMFINRLQEFLNEPDPPDDAPPIQKEKEQAFNMSFEKLAEVIIKSDYSYAKLGLILGIAAIVGGVVLGMHGIAGSASWTMSLLGLESHINDATPGVVLFIVGLLMVFVTKP